MVPLHKIEIYRGAIARAKKVFISGRRGASRRGNCNQPCSVNYKVHVYVYVLNGDICYRTVNHRLGHSWK